MSILKEFKEFAVKGNVVDMAVGIIIGAAFGKIITSVVADIIMPPIGILIGGVDFKDLAFVLKNGIDEATTVKIFYGKFIQTCIDFIIVAFAVFVLIKILNSLKRKQEAIAVESTPIALSKEEILLTEIRDILKNK